ncbi:MAG: hypothetical protein Q8R28_13920, partial [Dehalococcoidia bacterium]|nr:hypothetical protein [Dehalococcoidia bacterium]
MALYGGKPEAGDIQAAATQLERDWSSVRADMRQVDSHVAGTFEVWDQKLFPKRIAFHPAFARAKLDQAVNSQVSLNPKVLKEAARSRGGRGQDMHKKRADANEEGVKAVLRDAFAREPVPPPKQFFHYLMRYGVALLGIDWREDEDAIRKPTQGTQETAQKYKDRLAKWEEKKDGWDPIHVLIPHPGRTLCPPYQAEPECVIIRGQRYAKELYDLTRDKGRYAAKVVNAYDPKDSPYTMVKTLEWFSAGYHGLILDGGELLFMEEPFYKFQPFTLSYSGWGVEVYDGTEQSRDPRYLAVGLLHGLFEELVTHAKLLSSLNNSVYRNAFARLVGPHSEEWSQALDTDDAVLEGDVKDVGFLQFPAIQEALFYAIVASERRLE